MTDIPNTEYITINKDGVFIGGKRTTKYRGENIACMNVIQEFFTEIQRLNKNVAELHVLSSATKGEYAVTGNPSCKNGPNVWCRVLLSDGRLGAWVFRHTHDSAAFCAHLCVLHCAVPIRDSAVFRSAVFCAVDKEKTSQKPINPVVVAANNNAQNKR